MNHDIAEAWAKRLEENPERQGTGALAYVDRDSDEKRCCLGELCEMAVEAGITSREKTERSDGRSFVYYGEPGVSMFLPQEVQEWAGMRTDYGDYRCGALSVHNDNGMPWPVIARVIRNHKDAL